MIKTIKSRLWPNEQKRYARFYLFCIVLPKFFIGIIREQGEEGEMDLSREQILVRNQLVST